MICGAIIKNRSWVEYTYILNLLLEPVTFLYILSETSLIECAFRFYANINWYLPNYNNLPIGCVFFTNK